MVKRENLKKITDLFLISFIALYFEILFIRWIPSSVQIIAYFANVILISALLGLGLGCLLYEIKLNLMNLFPILVFSMVVLLTGLDKTPVTIKDSFITGEYLMGFSKTQGVSFLMVMAAILIFNTALFIPLGQKLGICLKDFKPLFAYSINMSGSIAGIAVFSYFSYLMLKPLYWFLFGLLLTLWFFVSSKKQLLLQSLIIGSTLFAVSATSGISYWSPYYKIDVSPYVSGRSNKVLGSLVSANNIYHQYAFNLSDETVAAQPELKHYKEIYEFPYTFVHPRNVLILGSGAGNDVAAAVRMGVKEISAVEIDPFIASLGKSMHGERPYLSKDVRLFIDDARSFIKKTSKKFDLITLGYLDAHKVLSQFSSVRLDNFVYTKESFMDIKDRLSREGMLSLTYFEFRDWVGAKLYRAMREVFGNNLIVFRTSTYREDDTDIFLAGPGVKNVPVSNMPNFKLYDGFDKNTRFITDDWPYLYLTRKHVPLHYIIILCLMLIVSFLSVICIGPARFKNFNPYFFLLGAGFMLLETVGIARFALLFGSTWIVNSVVIATLFVMILLANIYVERTVKINIKLAYILLISTIFLNWLLKPGFFLIFNRTTSIVLSSLVLSLPFLFASVIFAASFREVKDVPGVFAYNLLGAIAGGFFEYVSMAAGFNFLFLLATGIYCISYRIKITQNRRCLNS